MTRSALSTVAIVCLLLVAPGARANPKEQWTTVRSENFILVGDASESEIRSIAVRLEEFRSVLARLFSSAKLSQAVPTRVIVFKNDEVFKPFRPLYQGRLTDVAGYFQPGRDLNYIAISAERKGNRSFGTIFHELVHLFVDNNFRGMPLSFNEGLAEYYSSVKISDDGKKITFGKVSPQRAQLLRESKLLPLKMLLATEYNSDYYNEGDQRSLFYAQSWAFVHYLLHRNDGNGLERFTQFLSLLSQGSTIDDGLKEVFHSTVQEIETELQAYVSGPEYPTQVVAFDRRLNVSREMPSSSISLAEARAYVGDLLLHQSRLNEAEPYLQESLALNPDFVSAQASLGMLRVKQGRLTEAIQILRRAAAIDRQNYLTQYYLAYALSREGMSDEESVGGYQTAAVTEMRAALNRAIELAPNFIEAYRLLAFVDLARNEQLDKAEELLNYALRLSPARQDLMLILAQVHMREANFQAARKDIEPILQRASDAKLREQASSLLEDIAYAEAQALRPEYQARRKVEAASELASSAGTSLQLQAHAAKSLLAKRFKGERVRGVLTDIECMDKGVALSVKVNDRTLRLHAAELRSVFFVTYVSGLERTVTCGARASQNLVVLTYRLSKDSHARYDGEAIAIEFVPEDIEIEP